MRSKLHVLPPAASGLALPAELQDVVSENSKARINELPRGLCSKATSWGDNLLPLLSFHNALLRLPKGREKKSHFLPKYSSFS